MKESSNRLTMAVIAVCLLVIVACLVVRGLRKGEPEKEEQAPRERAPGVVEPSEGREPVEPSPITTPVPPEEKAEVVESPEETEEFDIAGIVVDKAGNPIEGTKVGVVFYLWEDLFSGRLEALSKQEPLAYETKEDGRFGFHYQEGKRYFLGAEKEDYVEVRKNMDGPQKDIVLTLILGGAIEGKVVDAVTGEPLEHFRIVTSQDIERGGLLSDIFKKREVDIYLPTEGKEFSDPEGKFRVSGLAARMYLLTSIAEGYAQSHKGGIEVEVEKTTTGIVIEQQPGGGISGHVVDAIGKPIEAAEIVQKNPIQSSLFGEIRLPQRKSLAATNEKGEFQIDGLPPGTFTLQARHAAYCPEQQKVKVSKGEVTTGVEFQLVQGGMISGVVLAKVDLQPVAGATVKASTGSAPAIPLPIPLPMEDETKTDQNGLFDIIKLEPGTYSLTVTAEDFAEKTIEDLTLGENESITDLIIELSGGGTLIGTVKDISGNPIVRTTIIVMGAPGMKMSQTDEQGKYAITNLKEGNYMAAAVDMPTEMDEATTTLPRGSEAHFVQIENDKETRLDIVVGGPRKVYGKVTLKGEPQEGLMITVQSSSKAVAARKSQSQGFARTDADGRYEIDNLQPAEYNMGVMKLVMTLPEPLFQTKIVLADHDLEKNIELPEGGISGKVVDADNRKPIEGARVTLRRSRPRDAEEAAMSKLGMFSGGGETTDAEGKYTFSVVEDGVYYAVASKEGYAPQGLTAEVKSSRGPSDVNFSLSSAETLSGGVIGSDAERRIKQIFLSAKDSAERTVYSETIPLSEEGQYEAKGLAPGEYVVSVDAAGYASASRKVTIRSGSDNRADFALTGGGTLIIRVVDDRRNPIPGVQTEIMDEQGDFFVGFFPGLREVIDMAVDAFSSEVGVNKNPNLPPGRYRVKVGALGYEDEFINVTVREGEETTETVTLRKTR